jgi:cytochrome c553
MRIGFGAELTMKTWLRRTVYVVLGLVTLVLTGAGVVYAWSASLLAPIGATAHAVDASGADVIEGHRLAIAFGCTGCHGGNLGGTLLIDALPFAILPANNLTSGRHGGAATDEQWDLAVRHGIGFDGRPLFIMPSREYSRMSDANLSSIMAWARSLPAVENPLPDRVFGPAGRMVVVSGRLPSSASLIPVDVQHLQTPAAPTSEFGYYLTRLCIGCHGPDLHGGPPGQAEPVPGPDLSPGGSLGSWTEAQFVEALRAGRRPDGSMLNDSTMPWQALRHLNDVELAALWAYLRAMPAS